MLSWVPFGVIINIILGDVFYIFLLDHLCGFPFNSNSNTKNKHVHGACGTQLWFESQCEEFH